VTWLEAFLKEFKGAVVMVTHDRSLLEALAEWVSGFNVDGNLLQKMLCAKKLAL